MTAVVRPWRPEDRPAIVALSAELQEYERARRPTRIPGPDMAEGYMALQEARLAEKPEAGALFVAEMPDGRIVGYAACFVDEDELEQDPAELRIEDLTVTEGFRRQGVGRALIAACCAFGRQLGLRRVRISVLTVNPDAEAAYAALGFRPVYRTLEMAMPAAVDPDAG